MRDLWKRTPSGLSAVVTVALGGAFAGCFSDYGNDCERNVDLACFWSSQSTGSGTTTTTTTSGAVCGNGKHEAGEECDDGNTDACDGCGPDCKVEKCGDKVVCKPEECDDGNTTSGDGCDATCKSECSLDSLPAGGDSNKTQLYLDPDTAHCYARVNSSQKSWGSARDVCNAWNGDLFAFTTQDEHDKVFGSLPGKTTWTGGTRTGASFAWANGEGWPESAPWAGTGPGDLDPACVEMDETGRLVLATCNNLLGYICERKPVATK